MNCIFLSPHFPPHYYLFCRGLRNLGVNVLGIADASYDQLSNELKSTLTEYFRVESMEDYDQLMRAVAFLTYKYGRIDRLDSHNEYWLEKEARLRTDFNIPGLKLDVIESVKLKSRMKEIFTRAGVKVVKGEAITKIEEALAFIKAVGYPVVLKPDNGVGASHTERINNRDDLERFFANNPPLVYFIEEFVEGQICTFDGLTDKKSRPVFFTSHVYSKGVMELAADGDHVYYYSLRDLPEDLVDAGLRTLKAFNVNERFFHIEFFRTPDGGLTGLEVNMRPPGGYTTDMFNYACDMDIYQEWAKVLVQDDYEGTFERKYFCAFVGRKSWKNYVNSHQAIMSTWGAAVAKEGSMPALFATLMGDTYYIVRHPDQDGLMKIINFIQAH